MAELAPSQENVSLLSAAQIQTLEAVQKRVLWLSTQIVHHANNVRPNPEKAKIGGHQASSASVVSIMTALYFHFLKAGDRVAVKPHASPVFHAIQYLLGQLPQEYLTQLRRYGGLQAYPSRTKDPDPVDFSTGSVGLGAVAPAFAALAHTYATHHFDDVAPHRFVALVGDAELDEGNVWEAILDPNLALARNLLWIVDLNRQSLDRVVPGIRAAQLKRLFAECGWRVVEVKYGHLLQELFEQPEGADLRRCIDEMHNEEYQELIALPGAEGRQRLGELAGAKRASVLSVVAAISDEQLPSVLSNLGGHDLQALTQTLDFVGQDLSRPTVLFAYTIKGWGLPIAGDPLNHSKLLSAEQMATLQGTLAVPKGQEWAQLPITSPAGALCQEAQQRLFPAKAPMTSDLLEHGDIPDDLGMRSQGMMSTQQALGQSLMSISRVPTLSRQVVTISPDVSTSTNLSGWIIKNGVFKPDAKVPMASDEQSLLSWKERPTGQHIELGISEMNLFMALGMFGLAHELCDQMMIPIGTVYDPFVCRGLDSLIYALYSGAKFIFAGTPSGISLAPEGGAHQSTVTPSLGIELPNLNAYEPCFVKEMEWMMIEALRQCCDREHGRATYFRLTTKQIDQGRMAEAVTRIGEANLRNQVLAGGYRIVDWRTAAPSLPRSHLVHLVATGAMVPDAMDAAAHLQQQGIPANVINLTSTQHLYEAWRDDEARHTDRNQDSSPFSWLLPPSERHAPIITILDGASHALAWLGSVYGMRTYPLGVDEFGQSGNRAELYEHFGINAQSIVETARHALVRSGIAL